MGKEAVSPARKRGTHASHRRFARLWMILTLLWALSGCGSDASAPEFPPAEETVRSAAAL